MRKQQQRRSCESRGKGFCAVTSRGIALPASHELDVGDTHNGNRGANVEQIHAGGGGAANLDPGQGTAPGVNFAHFRPTLGAKLFKRGKAAEIWEFFFFPSALSTCKSMAALQRLRHDSFKVEE